MKKSHVPFAPVRKFVPGQRYRGVQGKVVHRVEHRFEEGLLYIHVRPVLNQIWVWGLDA